MGLCVWVSTQARKAACKERCDDSNGPAGKACEHSRVRTRGCPPLTATSTATNSAVTASSFFMYPLAPDGHQQSHQDGAYKKADNAHGLDPADQAKEGDRKSTRLNSSH